MSLRKTKTLLLLIWAVQKLSFLWVIFLRTREIHQREFSILCLPQPHPLRFGSLILRAISMRSNRRDDFLFQNQGKMEGLWKDHCSYFCFSGFHFLRTKMAGTLERELKRGSNCYAPRHWVTQVLLHKYQLTNFSLFYHSSYL